MFSESLVSFRDGFKIPIFLVVIEDFEYYLLGICFYSLWLNSAIPLPTQNCWDSHGIYDKLL